MAEALGVSLLHTAFNNYSLTKSCENKLTSHLKCRNLEFVNVRQGPTFYRTMENMYATKFSQLPFNAIQNSNVLKIKTVLTRNNIIKYWKLSIDMCQSSSANDEFDDSDDI